MKKLLVAISCLFPTFAAQAQEKKLPPIDMSIKCGIWYDYDASGNRIKRYYDCKDPWIMPYDPSNPDPGGPMTPSEPFVTTRGKDSIKNKGITLPVEDAVNSKVVMVYPNPVIDQYNIRIPKAIGQTHFHIYDSKGAIITSGNIQGQAYQGRVGNLPSGNYMIVVYYNEKSYNFPITKL